MVISCGVDICETKRIAKMVSDHGETFLKRTFTEEELSYCVGRANENEHLGARFAAKEAVFKALGTGWSRGVSWLEVSVSVDAFGAPFVGLAGAAARVARERGIARFHVSLSHCSDYAVAMVVAEGDGG
jgi:holo-[acyl-carrier protein] synthase